MPRMYKGIVESERAVETESIHARVIIPCKKSGCGVSLRIAGVGDPFTFVNYDTSY